MLSIFLIINGVDYLVHAKEYQNTFVQHVKPRKGRMGSIFGPDIEYMESNGHFLFIKFVGLLQLTVGLSGFLFVGYKLLLLVF